MMIKKDTTVLVRLRWSVFSSFCDIARCVALFRFFIIISESHHSLDTEWTPFYVRSMVHHALKDAFGLFGAAIPVEVLEPSEAPVDADMPDIRHVVDRTNPQCKEMILQIHPDDAERVLAAMTLLRSFNKQPIRVSTFTAVNELQ